MGKKADIQNENPHAAIVGVLNRYIDSKGLRHTPERVTVLDVLCSGPSRFTIDEVLDRMAEGGYNISRGTIVNSVNLFQKIGLVAQVGNVGRFRLYQLLPRSKKSSATGRVPFQIQLHCNRCGSIKEVRDIQAVTPLATRRYGTFLPMNGIVMLHGTCSKCIKKDKYSKVAVK
ncbi:MAG: transcriptional repressor [Muribaculaceae bacterium]|nr:transcriptional repressor [Muribaculaceae bacterium]